jgi:uncharacterized protein
MARTPWLCAKETKVQDACSCRKCGITEASRARFTNQEPNLNWTYLTPIALLCCSNVFMTFAWYGQLKFPNTSLWMVIPISWAIALFEYCFAVPANRIGHQVYSAAQLKTMQEVITLVVFAIFSVTYLGEALKWNHIVAFGFIVCAAFFAFHKW